MANTCMLSKLKYLQRILRMFCKVLMNKLCVEFKIVHQHMLLILRASSFPMNFRTNLVCSWYLWKWQLVNYNAKVER